MTIDSYSFGSMTIAGRAHSTDLILYPDRIDDAWWRKEGHVCSLADLSGIWSSKPAILIIGTGDPGLMQVGSDLHEHCRANRIELVALPTAQAVDAYNGCAEKALVIAAFHLTC